MDEETTYKIVRFCFDENDPQNHAVIRTGLTREEAQEHCNDPSTSVEGKYFDGWREE